jgi:hypothetical protein
MGEWIAEEEKNKTCSCMLFLFFQSGHPTLAFYLESSH